MKKVKMLLAVATCVVALTACGGAGSAQGSTPQSAAESVEQAPDLTGTWKQVNGSDESYQEATISGDTIEIYWVSDGGDTKSLYWAGTYEAPTESGAYSWNSVNDHEKTDSALLASGDDTKTFSYDDGVLSYSASALGTTTTIKLEKAE